ncbi:hypothetical protein ACLBKS_14650 [Hylemonella sp. W303a]|uniref:hypothetical protein n=1 Tax=Hylemonella sp. W303a TaxID=3389873 RepID=UPI00396B342D
MKQFNLNRPSAPSKAWRGRWPGAWALVVVCGLSACSALNPRQHDDIRLVTEVEAFPCQRLGTTSVTVWAGVGPVARVSEAVEENLLIEARRQAFRLGGNALVSGASPQLGQRSFEVYRCP